MIQSVSRALDILEVLSQDIDKGYDLKEIYTPLNLNPATCSNLLKTLVERGYVKTTGKRSAYYLGSKAFLLTNNFLNTRELLSASVKPMIQLRDHLNESNIVSVLKNNLRVTLHRELTTHELQVKTRGSKDAYLTATGRLLIAYLEPEDLEEYIKNYGIPEKLWPEVNNKKDLQNELKKIRNNQLSINQDEMGVVGIAVPIYKANRVIASLGVYLPEARFRDQHKDEVIKSLKKAADKINKILKI